MSEIDKLFKTPKEKAWLKKYKVWSKHLRKTGIPRCMHCNKNMVNAKDSITGKISKHLWKHDCKCVPENIILCVG